mgnify:CR=1 FL=1
MPREPSADPPSPPNGGFSASFVEGCSDPVISVDGDGVVVYANPAVEPVLGYDPAELRGGRFAELIPEERDDERVRSIRRRLSTPAELTEAGGFACPLRHADGGTIAFSVRFHEHCPSGDPVYTGVFRDGVEEAATRELRTFRNLVEHAGHAVYVTDTDGTIEYVNPAFTEHTGYDPAEVIGETPAILNSGEMPDEYFAALWETLETGDVWEEDIVDRRRDGETYHAHQTIAPVFDDGGDISRFVAIQTDVTEKREAVGRLKQYRDVVEALGDPILLQNRDGEFELLNEAVSEFAGVPREELYGTDEFAFMDDATAEQIQTMKSRVLERGDPVTYEVSPELPGNGERRFSTVRYPQYDDDGTPAGTLAICRDVTDIKKHQRQFRVIERVLRHNLRNHFQVIRGVAESIEAEGSGRVAENAQTVVRTTDAVLETVDKERQITEFLSDPEPAGTVDLAQVAVSVAEQARRNHEDAAVAVDSPGQCNAVAVNLIDRAVEELVENAIVHSDGDSPTVTVTVTCDGDWAQVAVADDGPGIPAMERDVLTGRREIGPLNHGQGIGMWIVHLIVQESDGRLEFTENEPRGSVVTVAVPRPDRT